MLRKEVFVPYQLSINNTNGQNLYMYEFVQFGKNEHLLSGIFNALEILYKEIFEEETDFLQMGKLKVKLTKIDNFMIILIYEGSNTQANTLMCEILDKLAQEEIIQKIITVVESSVYTIPNRLIEEMNQMISHHQNVEFEFPNQQSELAIS